MNFIVYSNKIDIFAVEIRKKDNENNDGTYILVALL